MADFALYRFYGDAGTLLYVGITDNPDRRWKQHSKDKFWWREVRGITIDWYDTRRAVEAAERRAVAVEQPAYNKALRRKAVAVSTPAPLVDSQEYESWTTWTEDEVQWLEDFDRAWASRWWEAPEIDERDGTAYRHAGRHYANRPFTWGDDMLAQRARMAAGGVPFEGFLQVLKAVFSRADSTPQTVWPTLQRVLDEWLRVDA